MLNLPNNDPPRAGQCVADASCEDEPVSGGLCQQHLDAANAPDPQHHCDYCDVSYGLEEPPPLSALCEHGADHNRVFADTVRISTLPDGRVLVQLDMPGDMRKMREGQHVCCVLTGRDAERLRIQLGRHGAAVAERWQAP